MTKRIAKFFPTEKKAGQFQNRLYEEYPSVKLIQFPWGVFSEAGNYTWLVSDDEEPNAK
jgi:hypothetical protein